MQKREPPSKATAATPSPAKRGRPPGTTQSAAISSLIAAADAAAPTSFLGPTLQLPSSFAEQNNKRIVLALQSGLKSELIWALNALTVLSFKEKDDIRKDATPLAKIPGLLDALLQVVDDWRDVSPAGLHTKPARVRSLGANIHVTGFGSKHDAMDRDDPDLLKGGLTVASKAQDSTGKGVKHPSLAWWFEEDGLFNVDHDARAEKQQCAAAASNVIRNFSFMPENETVMAQHRHCLESLFQCMEDHHIEDEELVTNALETVVNLAPLLDLRIFSSSKPSHLKMTEKRAAQAIMGLLASSIKAWNCASAELLSRLIINPDNEPFLVPFAPQIYKRLVDLLSFQAVDAQAAAVGALYNLSEVNVDCRLRLANERWAVERLLRIIKTPHPVSEICKKSAMILESLANEPQNRSVLLIHEDSFVDILFNDQKHSDTFARILYELTARPNRVTMARGIWGM